MDQYLPHLISWNFILALKGNFYILDIYFILRLQVYLFYFNNIFAMPFRWNGYNVEDYKKVVEEYTKLEMVSQKSLALPGSCSDHCRSTGHK